MSSSGGKGKPFDRCGHEGNENAKRDKKKQTNKRRSSFDIVVFLDDFILPATLTHSHTHTLTHTQTQDKSC